MALTYDDLTGKTNRFIVPSLVDSIYKVSPVLTRLRTRNRMKFEGGRSIVQPLMYARLKGGAFARGQAFDVTYVQTDTSLEVLIKQYYVNCTLYGTDHILNRGPEAAMSLIESKMANAAGRMAELLATDMYLDGQGTNSSIITLDGFQASVDDGKHVAVEKSGYMLENQRMPGYVNCSRDNASAVGNQQGRPARREPSETSRQTPNMEKIKSELHGDMKRLSEMYSPAA